MGAKAQGRNGKMAGSVRGPTGEGALWHKVTGRSGKNKMHTKKYKK